MGKKKGGRRKAKKMQIRVEIVELPSFQTLLPKTTVIGTLDEFEKFLRRKLG